MPVPDFVTSSVGRREFAGVTRSESAAGRAFERRVSTPISDDFGCVE